MITKEEIKENIEDWVVENIDADFQFRPNQLEVIINIIDDIVNHKKQLYVVEAPTGTGKSLINIISAGVLAKYYDTTSFILCSDLFLWAQYDKFIKKHYKINQQFGVVKGQLNNYKCVQTNDDISLAPCRVKGVSWGKLFNYKVACNMGYDCVGQCPYIKDRKKAVRSKVCLMTYQLYFKMIHWNKEKITPATFVNRDVVFCDECHNISNIISSQYNLDVKQTDFDMMKKVWDMVYDASLLESQTNLFGDDSNDEDKAFYEDVIKSKSAFLKKLKEWKKQMFDTTLSKEANYKLAQEIYSILSKIVSPFVDKKLEEFKKDLQQSNTQLTSAQKTMFSAFNSYNDFYNSLKNIIETFNQCGGDTYLVKKYNYVFDVDIPTKQKIFSVTYLCAREDWMIYNYLLTKSKYKVFVSATIGTKQMIEETIGIDYYNEDEIRERISKGTMFYDIESKENPQDFEYIRLTTDFNFDKSPIYFIPGHKMSYKDKEYSLTILKPLIYKICESFGNQKGMIQTGSYQLMNEIIKDAPFNIKRRLLAYDNPKVKPQYIKEHSSKNTTNTILIGPTLCEGIDLPEDLCRFIIILKVPYPNLKDELTQEKIKLFPNWYNSTTSNLIIQGIGRGNRTKNDYCMTFILDGCFAQLYGQTYEQYPSFIRDRIKVVNG